jgi:V8-like Glu-specific endopeptidase
MRLWMMLAVVMMVMAPTVYAFNKVVYGVDDRVDVVNSTNPLFVKLSQATAGMVDQRDLTLKDDYYQIDGRNLEQSGICSYARFAQQTTAPVCSGFLVAPDLLVTAGHCVKSSSSCNNYRWVFGFQVDGSSDTIEQVSADNVYKCVEIVQQNLSRLSNEDFALIRLDRPVIDRTPVEVRTSGKIADDAQIVVIGHPSGLPTKIADGANVRGNTHASYFVTNLDTFAGNSGSAVFDAKTGLLEGILVRGAQDYTYDRDNGSSCMIPNLCEMDECRGEDVSRITTVTKLMEILGNE